MNEFPPPNTPPQPAPGASNELGSRLQSMVERTAPPVTAHEAEFTTGVIVPLRSEGPGSSTMWKVAAVGLGALAIASSAASYIVGQNAGRRSADKRIAVGPATNTPNQAASATTSVSASEATANQREAVAAPPATFSGGRAGGVASPALPVDSAWPADIYGPAPVKLFDRTVGTVTMHVYGQINGNSEVGPSTEPGGWSPPIQCQSTANVTAYVATTNFTGWAQGQEYPSLSVPLVGYSLAIGHPKVELLSVIPVQVPPGAKNVRLLKADKTVLDEMAPDKGWAFLVNTDAQAGSDGPDALFVSIPTVEVVLEDGRTVTGVMNGMPGSPQAAKECQPPPPPPPTIKSDYTALAGADLDAVTVALADTFGSIADRATPLTHLENGDKFTKEWLAAIKERAVALGAGNIEIKMSSAGVKGDKAVAIFQLGGSAMESAWQVVELVKGKDGSWLVTTPSFCRIAGMAYPCPADAYDPSADNGPQPVDYGSGYSQDGIPWPGVPTTVGAPQPGAPTSPMTAPATTVTK